MKKLFISSLLVAAVTAHVGAALIPRAQDIVPLPRRVLVGVHYFAGWYHEENSDGYSHFHGYAPRGKPLSNFFDAYPSRIPLLGNLTTDAATIQAEIAAAQAHGVDYFEILYYVAGADCGYNADPGLRWCLNAPLAFMLNTTSVWPSNETTETSSVNEKRRMHFCVTFSNDVDAKKHGQFVGVAGREKFAALTRTWVSAMKHPHYLRINGRPVFKILIPQIFLETQCANNATLANDLLDDLTQAAVAAGLQPPLIGGGWENPSIPSRPASHPRPHPEGYMVYKDTHVACSDGDACVLSTLHDVVSVQECERHCNRTRLCQSFELHTNTTSSSVTQSCVLKSQLAPGAPASSCQTYVRVPGDVHYDYTGTYNAAPPICPASPPASNKKEVGESYEVCPRYKDSWMPNATQEGAKVFPYSQCGDYQTAARTNHSQDPVPYVPNVIAGFDPRPWEEHSPSFAMPSETEWVKVLQEIKAQCEDPSNHFGFPVTPLLSDSSSSSVRQHQENNIIQPAFTIYAWNEYGEGGILAPSRGQRFMKLKAIAKVFLNATV